MDREFKTTFIPKKKLAKERGHNVSNPGKRSGLMSLLAGLLFVTTIISFAGVYVYKASASKKLEQQIKSINLAEKSFEPGLILSLKKLDIRLKSASGLLEKHIALSDFFDSLGETTLPDVSFSNFTFGEKDGSYSVSMEGEARGYLPIAQQSDLFEKNRYIQNHIFSDFQLTENNSVSFSLNFSLNPNLIFYGRNIKNDKEPIIDKSILIENEDGTLADGKNINFNNNPLIQQ